MTVAAPFPVRFNLPELANAAIPEKKFAFAISRNMGSENEQPPGFLAPRRISFAQSPADWYPCTFGELRAPQLSRTNWEGFSTASDRSITASIKLKIAVLAPMPRARVRIATALKPGDFRSMRNP